MKNLLFQTLIFITILLSSCGSKLDVPSEYVLSEEALREKLGQQDTNLVLFWTDWCAASKHRIETTYKPLVEQLEKDSLDLQLILLAADENVSIEHLVELRELGLKCYYIENPGNNAIFNRMAIKSYINDAFPNNKVEKINKFQFGIPVELLITKELEIVNARESSKSISFTHKILMESEQE